MRLFTVPITLALILFLASAVLAVGPKVTSHDQNHDHGVVIRDGSGAYCGDDMDVDFEDGDIIFTGRHHDDPEVRITEDYELYIDGEKLDLNDRQREIVAEYYDTFEEVIEEATKLGVKGAAIGAQGAALGVSALGKLFKAALTEYELEDMEREIEKEARKIEEKAEKLEWEAEEIEALADKLEELHWDLKRETPRLRDIEWF